MKINNEETRELRLRELEYVVLAFQQQLFRFAFFRVGHSADAQDVVQDVFLRFFREGRGFSAVSDLRGYLFRSVSNACHDHLRRRSRERFVPLDAVVMRTAEEEPGWTEEYERIRKLLEAIPEDQAEIIRMKTVGGLKFVEIAAALDLPLPTVKSKFRYGIDKIRVKLN